MKKVLSIDLKCFVDPLLLDKTIFCHFKIFKQVILVLLGNDYWKKWNQHYSLCENENVFAHHYFANSKIGSKWVIGWLNDIICISFHYFFIVNLLFIFWFVCMSNLLPFSEHIFDDYIGKNRLSNNNTTLFSVFVRLGIRKSLATYEKNMSLKRLPIEANKPYCDVLIFFRLIFSDYIYYFHIIRAFSFDFTETIYS